MISFRLPPRAPSEPLSQPGMPLPPRSETTAYRCETKRLGAVLRFRLMTVGIAGLGTPRDFALYLLQAACQRHRRRCRCWNAISAWQWRYP